MLSNAFTLLLQLHGREVIVSRPKKYEEGDDESSSIISGPMKLAPSNYFRHLAAPSDSVIYGREFVVSISEVRRSTLNTLERGDRIKHPDFGLAVISEVREMFDFGGALMGYRIRTS